MGVMKDEGDRVTRRKSYEYPGEPFPNGRWMASIEGVALMQFRGEDIRVSEIGVFFIHRGDGPGMHDGASFFPWHKVQRLWKAGG